MRILSWHRCPLKSLPPLIWVSEFEFVTPLSFDECYTKLNSTSDNQRIEISEVLKDDKTIYFAARKSINIGKWSASADLGGKVIVNETDGRTYVSCFVGEPVFPFVIGFLIFILLVILFSVFYFRVTIPIVGTFAFVALLPTVLGSIFSREIKVELKSDIIQFLSYESTAQKQKHPLMP